MLINLHHDYIHIKKKVVKETGLYTNQKCYSQQTYKSMSTKQLKIAKSQIL